jgi:hypothetical protein
MKVIQGKFLTIHQLNDFFYPITVMLLEHFDIAEYNNYLFSLGTYIKLSGNELKKIFPNKKIIIYQLEQLMGITTWQHTPTIINNIKSADEIWDYDHLNAHYLLEWDIQVNRVMPLLYSNNLEKININYNPEIDVLFYGIINDRRHRIFMQLQTDLYNNIKMAWIFGESNMDKYIANSKVILNLHAAEPWNRQEQVRLFYPVINGKTVISEISQANNMPNEIIESSIDDLSKSILYACNTSQWLNFGLEAKEKFKQRTQKYLYNEFGIIPNFT